MKNADRLQKVLNDIVSDKTFASTQKINDAIRQAFNRLATSYLYKIRSKSNNEYE